MLDREVFAPAERAADRGVADDDLLFGQLQHLRRSAAILVQPLPGGLDHHPPVVVDIGDAGLGLQEGVLLPGGRELALEHDVGLGEAAPRRRPCGSGCASAGCCRAPRAPAARPGASARAGRSRPAGLRSRPHQPRAGLGRSLRLGHDERHFVPGEADDVAAEDRLVVLDQPEGVVGHVGGGQHGDDARCARAPRRRRSARCARAGAPRRRPSGAACPAPRGRRDSAPRRSPCPAHRGAAADARSHWCASREARPPPARRRRSCGSRCSGRYCR